MSRRALVFNAVSHVVVAVSRSLARQGIEVTYADIRGNGKAPASRAIKHFLQLPNFEESPGLFRASLARAIEDREFEMLVPCSDPGLVALLDNYDWLRTKLHVSCPEPAVVRQNLDKGRTLEVAAQCGIAVPERFQIGDIEELGNLRSDLRFPLIAKPLTKENESGHRFKMRYFRSIEELRDAHILDADFGAKNILQEYCEGEGVGVELLLHRGQVVAAFQHRRLKELPISGGGSVACISEAIDGRLLEQSVGLLRRLGWEGVAMVEFKRDVRTRRSVLMEVNGRYWGSLPLAIAAGIDFPFYEWQLAHGEKPAPPSKYPIGMRFRWLAGDIRRIASLMQNTPDDSFPRPRLGSEAFRFVSDFRNRSCPALFSWSDPVPAFVETAAAVKKCLGILFRQFMARLRSLRNNFRYHGGGILISAFWLRVLSRLGLRRQMSLPAMSGVPSVLFVCHGNIIRSAMAEALFRKVASAASVTLTVASAGVSKMLKPRADKRARRIANEFGVSLEDHIPGRVSHQLIENSDVIVVMDTLNEAYLAHEFPDAKDKIVYLGDMTSTVRSRRKFEIADPYSGNFADIRSCFRQLEECTRNLLSLVVSAERNGVKVSAALPRGKFPTGAKLEQSADLPK